MKQQYSIRCDAKPSKFSNMALKVRLQSHGLIQWAMNPVMTHALSLAVLRYYGDGSWCPLTSVKAWLNQQPCNIGERRRQKEDLFRTSLSQA